VRLLTFATLLGFGLKLTEPQVPAWAAICVPLVLVLVVSALLAIQRAVINGVDIVQNESSEALLRYLIGLPAAVLVAFGLRQQAGRLVGPLKSGKLIRVLRIAGFGFLFYALVEGLIAPKTMFFPASLINVLVNEQSVYETLGIPIGIFRSIVGAVIALFLFRSLLAFRIEADRLAESLQQQQALMAERERISRDLHDGTIQSIYAAGLMLDDVHHTLVNRQQPTEAGDKLQIAMGVLNTTIQEIRGYIYDLRRSVAGDEDLTRGLVDIVTEFRLRTGIPIDWDVSGCGKFALSPDRRQHVYQITREALSNILRHAKASHAKLQLRYQDCVEDVAGSVQLKISDNGSGNAPAAGKTGRGLLNMRERATLLDAQLDIISKPGKGTEVVLELKG
jgi:signal transduction histidine kinase